MRKLLFTFCVFIFLLGTIQLVQAQSVSSGERQLIERELERRISATRAKTSRFAFARLSHIPLATAKMVCAGKPRCKDGARVNGKFPTM